MRRIHSRSKSGCQTACLWLEGRNKFVPTRALNSTSLRCSRGNLQRQLPCCAVTAFSSATSILPPRVWQRALSSWPSSSKVQQRGQHTQAAATEAQTPATPVCREGRPMGLSLGSLPLIEQQLSIAGSVFSLVAPLDVDAVMDMYIDKGCTESDPYWARAWPSAVALATQILQRPELVRGARVVELGSGLGLAGMAALKAGAREVVLLDREPLALQCALLSARASGLGSIAVIEDLNPADLSPFGVIHGPELASFYPTPLITTTQTSMLHQQESATPSNAAKESSESGSDGNGGSSPGNLPPPSPHQAHTSSLNSTPHPVNSSPSAAHSFTDGQNSHSGGVPVHVPSSTAVDITPQQRFSAQVFDWDSPEAGWPRQRFDVVLACDVLYESSMVDVIADVVPRLLGRQGGRLYVADPPMRTVANRERFISLLAQIPTKKGLSMGVDENYLCNTDITKLDNELVGGSATENLPVQLLLLRSKEGHASVGLK